MTTVWAAADWIERVLAGIAIEAAHGFSCAAPVMVVEAGGCVARPIAPGDRPR